MDAGTFHDAHEVYARADATTEWVWVATFATKRWAEMYADYLLFSETEVRPV